MTGAQSESLDAGGRLEETRICGQPTGRTPASLSSSLQSPAGGVHGLNPLEATGQRSPVMGPCGSASRRRTESGSGGANRKHRSQGYGVPIFTNAVLPMEGSDDKADTSVFCVCQEGRV